MNIRKKDISVHRNHIGAFVLSTMYEGYYVCQVYYTDTLKEARIGFIEHLRGIKHEN